MVGDGSLPILWWSNICYQSVEHGQRNIVSSSDQFEGIGGKYRLGRHDPPRVDHKHDPHICQKHADDGNESYELSSVDVCHDAIGNNEKDRDRFLQERHYAAKLSQVRLNIWDLAQFLRNVAVIAKPAWVVFLVVLPAYDALIDSDLGDFSQKAEEVNEEDEDQRDVQIPPSLQMVDK
jgi:hypothetical protein